MATIGIWKVSEGIQVGCLRDFLPSLLIEGFTWTSPVHGTCSQNAPGLSRCPSINLRCWIFWWRQEQVSPEDPSMKAILVQVLLNRWTPNHSSRFSQISEVFCSQPQVQTSQTLLRATLWYALPDLILASAAPENYFISLALWASMVWLFRVLGNCWEEPRAADWWNTLVTVIWKVKHPIIHLYCPEYWRVSLYAFWRSFFLLLTLNSFWPHQTNNEVSEITTEVLFFPNHCALSPTDQLQLGQHTRTLITPNNTDGFADKSFHWDIVTENWLHFWLSWLFGCRYSDCLT